jgi:hypothetical protein
MAPKGDIWSQLDAKNLHLLQTVSSIDEDPELQSEPVRTERKFEHGRHVAALDKLFGDLERDSLLQSTRSLHSVF